MKSKKGFTLIELVVVMAIIAVLALLVVGAIIVARNTSIRTANQSNMKTLQTGLEAQYAKDQDYTAGGTVGSGDSFEAAATAVGVDLGNGSCDDTNGGGEVTTISQGYYLLTAYGVNCTAADDDAKTVEVGTPPSS